MDYSNSILFLLISMFIVIFVSLLFDMHASMTGLNGYIKSSKSSQSINNYEKYKFLARMPQAIYAPFFAIFIISIELDQKIIVSTFIYSVIAINIFLFACEIYFLKVNSITYSPITRNFKFKEKLFTASQDFDIFIILLPISLNLLGIYLIPKYSQAVVQFLGIFQGLYTFFIIFFMKRKIAYLMDDDNFTILITAQILLCKIIVRILIIFFSIFCMFLYFHKLYV